MAVKLPQNLGTGRAYNAAAETLIGPSRFALPSNLGRTGPPRATLTANIAAVACSYQQRCKHILTQSVQRERAQGRLSRSLYTGCFVIVAVVVGKNVRIEAYDIARLRDKIIVRACLRERL